ncbi:hypothetical protein [Conexibacter sp. DBS9H8]|uniref:hypothetical protein n=1 Tax=Conexibacter sp. DBS9H8 TaxID=2937801 RepID=UPI00200DDBD7|nr:hypothetical protein [Conexibacter sp. DBS9H8]
MLDVTEEYYLETAQRVFRDHELARGCFTWKGRLVEPSYIKSALLTIEGGRDEMCPPGQTSAAHDLCPGIPAEYKRRHLQPDVGHYGVFNGQRFDAEIYPQILDFISVSQALAV